MLRNRCYQIESARSDLARAIEVHGSEHPAARAAKGRWRLYAKHVPQIGLASIEAIAWARESDGCVPDRPSPVLPIWNRSQRRHRQAAWRAIHEDVPIVSEPTAQRRLSGMRMQVAVESQVQP
jgi:hypothetical protein